MVGSGKKSRKSCAHYPSISCEDHTQVYSKASGVFKGVKATPTTIIAYPDGKRVYRLIEGDKGNQIMNAMRGAVKKCGPGIPLRKWRKAKADVAKADGYMEEGKAKKAITLYKKYAKSKLKGLKTMGEAGMKKANEAGLVAYAEALKIEDDAEAVKRFQKLGSEYSGTEAGLKARAAAKDIKKARESADSG